MTKHMTGTRNEWLAARLELLEAEKELTRRSDELARRRQELPWVRIDKEYRFETDEGSASLTGPLPRALAAPRLPLHVRARLHGGVPVLLGDRGRVQRLRRRTWPTTTSCFRRCRGRRSRSCRHTSGGWGGRSPGRPRSAATSTSTSTSGSPRSNSARGHRVQLPARGGVAGESRRRGAGRRVRGHRPEPTRRRTRARGRA